MNFTTIEKVLYVVIIILFILIVTPLKSMTLECERATIKATEIYAEFLDGKRTWKSTIPYDKKMKEVCK